MTIINHECYVSLEVAKLLKEVGFDWEEHYPRNFCYVNDNPELFDKSVLKHYMEKDDVIYLAPTLEVAQRWLREVKGIQVDVMIMVGVTYNFELYDTVTGDLIYIQKSEDEYEFDTYEEALEAGIKKALEIILEKGE